MGIPEILIKQLTEKITQLDSARQELRRVVDSSAELFAVRFLVLAPNEAALISPKNTIEKTKKSLEEVGIAPLKKINLCQINPFRNSFPALYSSVMGILDEFVSIKYFKKLAIGLEDKYHQWFGYTVILVFLHDSRQTFNVFYTSLIQEFHRFVQDQRPLNTNEVNRVSENAAYLTLLNTLPIESIDELITDKQLQSTICDLLIRTMKDVSARYYESAECEGYLQLINNERCFDGLKFKQEIKFCSKNAQEIRKLLETAKHYPLVIQNGNIIGIANKKLQVTHKYTFHILGHLSWEYQVDGNTIFVYKNSDYIFPNTQFDKKTIENDLASLFSFSTRHVNQVTNLITTALGGHGALIIISDNAQEEVKRLCNFNRGIQINPFQLKLHTINVIADLALIDGAIFLDNNLICHAFGVILDGKAVTLGTTARGARYNTAKNYIESQKQEDPGHKYYSIVISEDGMVDTFSSCKK